MANALLTAFYQSVQDNLQVSPIGNFHSSRALQESVTIENWRAAHASLDALKNTALECTVEDVEKLVNHINAANAVGLICGFINGEDMHNRTKSDAFDQSGITLHVNL